MRRPKAAIPILPPPDILQNSRGRGRTTQQYQNNQPAQQIEQETKNNIVAGSDEKPVPGQFDSVEIEQSSILNNQEFQNSQPSNTVRTVNVDESIDQSIDVDANTTVDILSVKKDNVDESISVKELLETTSSEKNTITQNPTTLATTTTETECELNNIESTIVESTIVEKAAA